MAKFAQAEVDYLVAAKKFISRTVEDNSGWKRKRPSDPPTEIRITYDIRRKDNPGEDIGLRFHARKELGPPFAHWGASLKWQTVRIRGLNYKLREDIIRDGLIIGKIRHWHEHIWNEQDGDKNIIDANDLVKNEDMRSIIELCMRHWNIEGFGEQLRLEQ